MKFGNLLVISNSFPNEDNTFIGNLFVKEQLLYLKNYFDNIYVIIPVPHGIELLRKTKHKNYNFDNVHVYFIKYFNFPIFYFLKRTLWIKLEKNALITFIKTKNLQFDLIHAHFTWPSGAVSVELKKQLDIPVVITEHTHISLRKELKRKNKSYMRTLKLCDAIIRINKGDIFQFVDAGVLSEKVFYVPNGYSSTKYKITSMDDCRDLLGLAKSKKIILNISRLYDEKGQKYLIESIKKLLVNPTDILLFIGGSGPLKDKLQLQIHKTNLQDHVQLVGFISDGLMPIWMNACDLFVLPSLSESFGIVQIEAMACGKPVVATRNGGSEDIIVNEKLGTLVDPKDVDGLAKAISKALATEWDQEYIRMYAERYTWENIAREIVGVYIKVLGN